MKLKKVYLVYSIDSNDETDFVDVFSSLSKAESVCLSLNSVNYNSNRHVRLNFYVCEFILK